MGRIRAVLFDLDGVLVDARDWHFDALNRALASFGFTLTRQEHEDLYDGLPTRRKLEILSERKGLPPALHDPIHRLKQVFTREEILARCVPVAAKVAMVRLLRKDGYRLGVCSNAIRDSVNLMLRHAGLLEYLECALSQEDVERPKPEPDIYREAMARLASAPEETVIVEDGRHGLESGQRAGGHVLQVRTIDEVDHEFVRRFIEDVERAAVKS